MITGNSILMCQKCDIRNEISAVLEVGMDQVGLREHLKQGWMWLQVGGCPSDRGKYTVLN